MILQSLYIWTHPFCITTPRLNLTKPKKSNGGDDDQYEGGQILYWSFPCVSLSPSTITKVLKDASANLNIRDCILHCAEVMRIKRKSAHQILVISTKSYMNPRQHMMETSADKEIQEKDPYRGSILKEVIYFLFWCDFNMFVLFSDCFVYLSFGVDVNCWLWLGFSNGTSNLANKFRFLILEQ